MALTPSQRARRRRLVLAMSCVSGAEQLLGGEANGMAVDFTDGSMVIRDSATVANRFSGHFSKKLTITGTLTASPLGVFIDTNNFATLALSSVQSMDSAVTAMAEFRVVSYAGATAYFALTIDDGTTNNRHVLQAIRSADSRSSVTGVTAAATQYNSAPNATAYVAGTIGRLASASTTNNGTVANNGVSGANDTTVTMPAVTTIRFGRDSAGNYLTGYLRKVLVFPRCVGLAHLEMITKL